MCGGKGSALFYHFFLLSLNGQLHRRMNRENECGFGDGNFHPRIAPSEIYQNTLILTVFSDYAY